MSVATRPTLDELQQAYAEYRRTPKFRAKVRRSFFMWRSLGWLGAGGPLVLHAAGWASWIPLALRAVCLVAIAYISAMKAAGALCRAAGSRKATKREPQHLFGYGSLGHERWYNLIPVSPGVNWMENALLFGGHRSKRHPWKTFWRTVIAALLVRGWWVAGALATAVWYWSPTAVITWIERVASGL